MAGAIRFILGNFTFTFLEVGFMAAGFSLLPSSRRSHPSPHDRGGYSVPFGVLSNCDFLSRPQTEAGQ
jgi:hypothetical protein